MAFSQEFKDRIFNAFNDHTVCMLGTQGENGPNISPKGSMIIYDDEHLAYWERSKKSALENLRKDPRVVVMYSNKAAFAAGDLPYPGGIIRFYGTAEIHESGELRDKIHAMLPEREINHEGAEDGFAVLIRLDRAVSMRGDSVR